MLSEEELIKKRLCEAAERSYKNNMYVFTDFLGMAEQDILYKIENDIKYAGFDSSGGIDGTERCIVRFGDTQKFGYEQEYPISCIKVVPMIEKFSDELSHRDYLGALMNLGIERNTLGDILIKNKTAFIFCVDRMEDYILENLQKIKHTYVKCQKIASDEELKILKPDIEIKGISVASERCDLVICKTYNISRNEGLELFHKNLVFINGRCIENNSMLLKKNDIISVRGYGRFEYYGSQYINKKGKTCANIGIWK